MFSSWGPTSPALGTSFAEAGSGLLQEEPVASGGDSIMAVLCKKWKERKGRIPSF